jgi:AcrR family transcriptional regulator
MSVSIDVYAQVMQQLVAMRASEADARSGPPRPPGRGERFRGAVLKAALEELADRGFAALSIESVARRAGVHKTSVYRHWADREALVLEALTANVAGGLTIPDTGTFETDLREFARRLVAWLMSPLGKAVVQATVADASRVPEIGDLQRSFYVDRLQRDEVMIRRAIERGEIPADTDAAEVIKVLIGPIYLRFLITAEPIDATTAERAAELALAAVHAGILHSRRAPQTKRRTASSP